jgi:metal-responsive CopG/Arc/MetJ family transcriptional regulator
MAETVTVSARMPEDLIDEMDRLRYEIGAENGDAPDRTELLREAAEEKVEELRARRDRIKTGEN